MPRPRQFDETHALSRAMTLFWERGYEQTSMDDLVRATGVHRGTLYGLYKDKRGLLLAALDRYIDEVIRPQTELLRGEPDGWAALEGFFHGFLDRQAARIAGGEPTRSCLAMRCALDLGTSDADVSARLQAISRTLEDAFEAALRRAQIQGRVSPQRDARALAGVLRSALLGLQVMSRTTTDVDALRAVARATLALVETPQTA